VRGALGAGCACLHSNTPSCMLVAITRCGRGRCWPQLEGSRLNTRGGIAPPAPQRPQSQAAAQPLRPEPRGLPSAHGADARQQLLLVLWQRAREREQVAATQGTRARLSFKASKMARCEAGAHSPRRACANRRRGAVGTAGARAFGRTTRRSCPGQSDLLWSLRNTVRLTSRRETNACAARRARLSMRRLATAPASRRDAGAEEEGKAGAAAASISARTPSGSASGVKAGKLSRKRASPSGNDTTSVDSSAGAAALTSLSRPPASRRAPPRATGRHRARATCPPRRRSPGATWAAPGAEKGIAQSFPRDTVFIAQSSPLSSVKGAEGWGGHRAEFSACCADNCSPPSPCRIMTCRASPRAAALRAARARRSGARARAHAGAQPRGVDLFERSERGLEGLPCAQRTKGRGGGSATAAEAGRSVLRAAQRAGG
jgi:hypothetical protein